MKYFPIKKLEQFSDIKAHTIRTWEKRHNIFKPIRNGNIRSYSLDDVRLLLNINILLKQGHRISGIAKMALADIDTKVQSIQSLTIFYDLLINTMLTSMYAGEIEKLEQALDTCVSRSNIDTTIKEVIIPFLERTQLLSYNDTSSEAHFAVTAIRRKLILGIETLKSETHPKQTALLFLPEGEHYDLLLLYHNYILKANGLKILYLGTNISPDNFETVIKQKRPDYIYTYITTAYSSDLRKYIHILENELPDSSLHIAEEEKGVLQIKTKIKLLYTDHKNIS